MTQYSGKIIRRNPVLPTQQSASGVWTTEDAAVAVRNNNWPVPGVPDPISRSLRFRASASAYLNRTPAVAGSRTTWTMSFWMKLGNSNGSIFGGASASNNPRMQFYYTASTGYMEWYQSDSGGGTVFYLIPNQLFRDPSAWYHIVVVADTTQATSSNRLKWYVNGVQVTSFNTATYPSQNTNTEWNTNTIHNIGRQPNASAYWDGYLTEMNFIDGQALTPSSFGTTDTFTGAWIPMPYRGTYGTNGFYIDFRDNTSTTTLGNDYSGNSNNWTTNNISLTAGSTYDSMLDVPTPWVGYSATTDTSAVTRGNYAVMNPLDYVASAFSGTASNGNLTVSIPAPGSSNGIASSMKVFSTAQPKFYVETTVTALTTFCSLGMISGTGANYRIRHTQDITINVNDVIMTAFDPATGNIWYGRNGTWLSSGNPSAGTNPFYTIPSTEIVGSAYCVLATNGSTGTFTTNTTFGQQPFAYTLPTGFRALCATNLPTPTILNGAQYMAATLYTGNGTTTQSISNAVNGVSFRPDFVWNKTRSNADDHRLVDVVRGGGTDLSSSVLYSNLTNAQDNSSGYITQTSNGFNLGVAATPLNMSGRTYVAWQWNAGGTTSSNTNGSITSTVSVNTTAGFSVVTFTGNNSTGTVGHGLGVAPSMIIQKPRNSTGSWAVYHASLGAGNAVWLNLADASASYPTVWNSTAPTSSVYSVGSYMGTSNYVAYCWAAVAGYSAFGSYTGNGSNDGPFVYTGFRPRFIMTKNITTGGYWWEMVDSSREPINPSDQTLYANVADAEYTSSAYNKDLLSNGFKMRGNSAGQNASGDVYIYMAFAENPFKYSNAR